MVQQEPKTFLYKQLIAFLESENKKVIKTATTGIAADLMDGRTRHGVLDYRYQSLKTAHQD